jgi:hypothetical protein
VIASVKVYEFSILTSQPDPHYIRIYIEHMTLTCSQSELTKRLYRFVYIFIVLELEKMIKMTHIYVVEN